MRQGKEDITLIFANDKEIHRLMDEEDNLSSEFINSLVTGNNVFPNFEQTPLVLYSLYHLRHFGHTPDF